MFFKRIGGGLGSGAAILFLGDLRDSLRAAGHSRPDPVGRKAEDFHDRALGFPERAESQLKRFIILPESGIVDPLGQRRRGGFLWGGFCAPPLFFPRSGSRLDVGDDSFPVNLDPERGVVFGCGDPDSGAPIARGCRTRSGFRGWRGWGRVDRRRSGRWSPSPRTAPRPADRRVA